jgi:hypothetical protein
MQLEKNKLDLHEFVSSYFSGRNRYIINALYIGVKDEEFFDEGFTNYLVQPSKDYFGKLKKLYSNNERIHLYNIAICENNGSINFKERALNNTETIEEKIELEPITRVIGMDFYTFTITADTSKFNLININASGKEFDILKQIDLNEVSCEMLIIDFNGKLKEMYITYVNSFGMELVYQDNNNLIFTKI